MTKQCLSAAALVLLLLASGFAWKVSRQGTRPTDLAELVEAAEAAGLCWTTGSESFPLPNQSCSVVISETQITCEEANLLHVGSSSGWKGRARAYVKPYPLLGNDPPSMDFVGEILVVGDPEFIRRIAELSRQR
jgi:hypothetical protein